MIERVSVRVYQPCEDLRGHVTFFYCVDVAGPISDFLYPEWGNVRFALSGRWKVELAGAPPYWADSAVVFGPTDRCGLISTTGGRIFGFGLTPLGWHAVLRTPAAQMTNGMALLAGQIGGSGAALRAELIRDEGDRALVSRLEAVLTERVRSHPPIGDLVLKIDAALRQEPADVAQFAQLASVSPRTLQRACLTVFGFAPKRLLRLQRFLDTLGRVRSAVGAGLADGLGGKYYDQPQFYRDFRDFMQMTPRAYLKASRELMAAAALAQVEAGVTLSFELPPPPPPAAAEQVRTDGHGEVRLTPAAGATNAHGEGSERV